ncbi:MAG: TVP38/TMEM64 family protein [Thermoleophilaceae bacterium]
MQSARLRLAIFAAIVLGLFATATLSGSLPNAGEVRDWGEDLGWAGPLVFVPAAACALCLFVPGPVLAGGAGLLFGTAAGTPIALAFIVVGAVMQMSISRYLAGDAAVHLLPERVKRFDRFIEERGFWAVFYMRLAPAIPYNLVNYGAGLTSLRVRAMAAGTAVGALPRTFAWVALGGSLDDLGSPEAKVAIALLVVMAVLGALLARRQLASERSA